MRIKLSYLVSYLTLNGARSVKTVALLDKPSRREVDYSPDYVGLEIPDEFVVGMQVSGNHVSSAMEGDSVRGVATPVHIGRSSHLWNVEIFTSTGKLVSSVRVLNSVLKKRG